ncbi:DUF6221 family protein [Streptomyces sp. NPDC054933]
MTGLLEFLEQAWKQAEETARATTPVPVAGVWAAVRAKHADEDAPLSLIQGQDPDEPEYQGYGSGLPVIAIAAEWQDESEANLRHIALHDPAAVLRRITAERKILAECREAVEEEERLHEYCVSDVAHAVVRALAEAWGWTGVSGEPGGESAAR